MQIKDLFLNKQISEVVYQVRSASYRESEGGGGYYLMRLGDKTGQVDAIWLNSTDINLKSGDYLCVDGKVHNYQGRMQLKISSCFKVKAEMVDQEQFSQLTVDKTILDDKLIFYIDSISIKPLHSLLKRLLLMELYKDFTRAPAASFNHHSYIGGLFEHTIAVTDICSAFLSIYPGIEKDILIAGALLHDLGKIYEFDFGEGITYSTKGNLLGHIAMGACKFGEECQKEKNFPEYVKNAVMHIILSHHGMIERGSPVLPCTLEAILVHKADTTDADAKAFEMSKKESAGGSWAMSRNLNRNIFVESPPKFELRKLNE